MEEEWSGGDGKVSCVDCGVGRVGICGRGDRPRGSRGRTCAEMETIEGNGVMSSWFC